MKDRKLISRLTVLSYVLMISINIIANILPINGKNTGEISDKYLNLFAPAGYVFSIWLVIYLLLAMYTMYQFNLFSRRSEMNDRVVYRVNQYFILSSLLNSAWVFAWHYEKIGISLILMIGIFISLFQARNIVNHRSTLTKDVIISVKLPFSVYFGWIMIALIANVTTYLVYSDWDRFSINESTWTVIMLLVGTLIGIITILRWKDISFGGVFLWAYTGILIKHLSKAGFNKAYYNVLIVTMVSVLLFIVIMIIMGLSHYKKRKLEKDQLYVKEGLSKMYESTDYYEEP